VVLVVNVASACGYTPQYAGLQRLYAEAAGDGLVVLGVPANEFGAQEPGSNAEIAAFCEARYGVTFPMAGKVVVKGDGQHPLYAWLTAAATPPGDLRWNFEKFLVGRDGTVVGVSRRASRRSRPRCARPSPRPWRGAWRRERRGAHRGRRARAGLGPQGRRVGVANAAAAFNADMQAYRAGSRPS
jgi:glutathione peroxidase